MRIGTADSGQATPNPCYSGSYGVTIDMIVNITEPPACVPPSGLTADNITGTTADFSWTGNDGNISWEYVLLPTGSEAPTEADTVTTETSVQFTGLDYETTYDVYVISNCDNSETSTWSGPLTFTTAIQSEFTLECGSENININYCYTDNETTTWLFNSDSGFPLEITFNSGTIETFDNITVYDGVDNTGAVLFNNNASGLNDLAGLVIVSTSTSVYIELDSDGFGSCESSTFYTPWDFTVACKTCVTQSATFEVVGACEPNQQFYVDVELTDLGDAININMTDGSSTQTSQSIGVFNFGPYDANSNVVITVTNADDESCSVNSGELTLICAPSPNDCSIIYAGEDVAFCEGTSTNLTAVYHPLGQDSNSYDVTVQQGCPTPPLEGGTPTSVETDDTWSGVIDIGFEFCFFGDTYSQLLVGSNGVLSFELENSEGYNGWSYNEGDTLPNASNTSLTQANIFGAAHDIDPYECGSINYMVLGSAPSRLFVVNFSEVCHFSCDDINSSSQIILYESSNTIDINIYNKPVCETWNGGLAVVGVQNIDDTLAFTPPDRNTGLWEATDEFWRFTPSLGTDDYVFEWYEGGTFIGNDDTVSVSPTETTIYTAAITYNLCTGGSTIVTDTVVVEVTPNPEPVATNEIIFQCPEGESLLEVTVDADIADTTTFYWTYDGVDLQSGPENTYLVPVGQFGEYLVTAINEEGCFGETLITVNEAPLFEVFATSETVYLCPEGESLLEVTVDAEDDEIFTFNWTLNGTELQSSTENTYLVPEGQFGEYLVTAINEEGCYGEIVITVIESVVPELEDGTSFIKCMNEDVELSVTVLNPDLIGNDLSYTWFIDGDQVQSGSDEYYMHTADQTSGMVTVVVTDLISMCESATTIEVANYMNSNCLDMPQGLSPNGDGMNDCLELDHLEDQEDIVKIEIFNRYGVKVFEMNDYMDQWCGQDASDGNIDSEELLPVGTYFYVIQFGSEREPIISWIYLNY
jgi:gliding motility-associated-like protein